MVALVESAPGGPGVDPGDQSGTGPVAAGTLWLRAELRRRWRSWLTLTLLVGVLGGAVLAAAAGARRTDTALGRFVAYSHGDDLNISPVFPGLAALRGVAAVDELVGEPLLRVSPDGRVDPNFPIPVASVDGRALYQTLRPVMRAGRLPSPDRPDEAVATVEAAARQHLHVGSRITLRDLSGYFGPDNQTPPAVAAPNEGTAVEITIVGIGIDYSDLAAASARSQGGLGAFGTIYLTPAYVRAHGGPGAALYTGALVELRAGTDLGRLRRDIDALAAAHPLPPGGSNYDFSNLSEESAAIQRAMHPDAVALWLFAALIGLASALLVGQALARQAGDGAADFPVLRSLGVTRTEFVVAATIPTAVIALAGGLVAVAGSILASPLTPVGPARLAEPRPGVAVNVTILGIGLVAIVVSLTAQVALSMWQATDLTGIDKARLARPSRLVGAAAGAGLPPAAIAGLRLALEPGRGRNAVPLWRTMTGAILAIAAVVVALTFNVNLGRLSNSPSRYGWNWDLAIDGGYTPLPTAVVRPLLAGVGGVAGIAGGNYGNLVVNGRLVPAVGIDQLDGSVFPTLLAGRPPLGADEIVLGTSTLRQAKAAVGRGVDVQAAGDQIRTLQVTGRAIFPDFERGGFTATDLGVGATATSQVLHPTGIPPGVTYNFFLVRFQSGASKAAVTAAIGRALAPLCANHTICTILADRRPGEVNAYSQVAWTPLVLAGVLAGLAAVALGNAIVSSVRRRRRDLAVLKTLGFTRAQVFTAVAWQSSTLVAAALVVGLPVGAAGGRWLWSAFARQLGVSPDALTPLTALLITIPAAIVVANIVAAVPAWTAARVPPSRVLRAE